MRERFSNLLTKAAKEDERILLLTGDHGYALFDEFRSAYPDRFINCGIAEQNMLGVAAGLAKSGFRPIVYGLAAFVPIRVLEQIKIDICYEKLPIIIIGDGAGVVYGHLGTSHQCNEDVAALRAVPNINIYTPSDRAELNYCFHHMLESATPSYLRFGKSDLGDVHQEIPNAPQGDPIEVINNKSENAIIASGSMVKPSLSVSEKIGNIDVWSMPIITPTNKEKIMGILTRYQNVYTMEEHSIHGGIGSLISEISAQMENPVRVISFGIENKFSDYCGDYYYLMQTHGLDVKSLIDKIQSLSLK